MLKRNYIIHTEDEIKRIRVAAHAAALAREEIASQVRAGMSTKELDMIAAAVIRSLGGKPAFLGYCGYPGTICISVNDEVVHGIARNDRFILKGDIVTVDVGVIIDGAYGDTAKTVYVPEDDGMPMPEDIQRLLDATRLSLDAGIAAAKNGAYMQDVSRAVENIANHNKLGVVREYVGHGCGTHLHEPPEVPNFATSSRGVKLVPGMVLCIEPMLNLGSRRIIVESDNWTVRTADGKWSAHFEHMVLINEGSTEVLTSA